jgi:hypothetical protein
MASHNPDPTSRSNQPFDQRIIDLAKSSSDQASLHAGGGREDPPARDTQGSAPFVVRVGLEAARNYPTRQRKSADDRIHRITDAEFFDEQRRAAILAALDEYEHALRALDLHP